MTNIADEAIPVSGKALLASLFFMLLPWSTGHAASGSTPNAEARVLATVNGDSIDEQAFYERIKTIHWQQSGKQTEGGAGSISIGEIVEKMIDEKLMLQEARQVGLDKTPDFVKRLDSYVKTQSALRLRQEEILEKAYVSEEAVLEYFRGEFGNAEQSNPHAFDSMKERIAKKLKKEQEKALSESFVDQLRQKAHVWVDNDLVDNVDPERDYSGNTKAIARVDGEPIPFSEFVSDLKRAVRRQKRLIRGKEHQIGMEKLKGIKEGIIERLITYRLIEHEALSRGYMKDSGFVDMVEKRKAALLVDAFRAKLVYPLAIPTEKELKQYYDEHTDEFAEGYEVWIREMRFQDKEEAEKILKELRQGASFEFLASQVAGGMPQKKNTVWVPVDRFAPDLRTAINGLKVGQVSDVISHGRKFKIIKLKGKRGGKPIGFPKAEKQLKRQVGQEKFERVLSEYLSRLRKASNIKIHEKTLEEVADRYWMGLSREKNMVAPHN